MNVYQGFLLVQCWKTERELEVIGSGAGAVSSDHVADEKSP
jgi:hypothetical protein